MQKNNTMWRLPAFTKASSSYKVSIIVDADLDSNFHF